MSRAPRSIVIAAGVAACAVLGATPAAAGMLGPHSADHAHHARLAASQPRYDGRPGPITLPRRPGTKHLGPPANEPTPSTSPTASSTAPSAAPTSPSASPTSPAPSPTSPSTTAPTPSDAPTTPGSTTPTSPSPSDPFSLYTNLVNTYSFSGSSIDQNVWSIYKSGSTWVPGLASVSDDMLHVTTNNLSGSGLCICRSTKPTTPYGRWDVRARASADDTHGFAILLWPNAGKWPEAGEIDMAEFNGARNLLYTTLHYGSDNSRYIHGTSGDFTQWHTYSVAWSPQELDYAVDGQIVMQVHDTAAIPDDAMHLAIQAQPYHANQAADTSADLDVAWVKQYAASS